MQFLTYVGISIHVHGRKTQRANRHRTFSLGHQGANHFYKYAGVISAGVFKEC